MTQAQLLERQHSGVGGNQQNVSLGNPRNLVLDEPEKVVLSLAGSMGPVLSGTQGGYRSYVTPILGFGSLSP